MGVCVATVVTCWLCLVIVTPRKPRWGNQVEELVYTRLLGRQHRLLLVALVVTAISFFTLAIQLPARIDPGLNRSQNTDGSAAECVDAGRTCISRHEDGTLHIVSLGSDGMWHVIAGE